MRYHVGVLAVLLACLTLDAHAAVLPVAPLAPWTATRAAAGLPRKRKPRLKLRRSKDRRLRDAKAKGGAVRAPLAVPHPGLKPRPLPDFAKGASSAKAVVLPTKRPERGGAAKRNGKGAARPAATGDPGAARKRTARDLSAAPKPPAVFARAAKEAAGTPLGAAAPKARTPRAAAAPAERPRPPSGAGSGASRVAAKGTGGSKASKPAKRKRSAGGTATAKKTTEKASKPAKPSRPSKAAKALQPMTRRLPAASVPAPPALPLVEKDGRRRLPAPAEPEPAAPDAYFHDGAWWLPARDGRSHPSLKAGGIYWLYEVREGDVRLRPAFPGPFRGRADDPTLALYVDASGGLLVQTYGDRGEALLWADASAPRRVAALGDRAAAAAFGDGVVVLRRRDGTRDFYGPDGEPLAGRAP